MSSTTIYNQLAHTNGKMSPDSENNECPLCTEEFDVTDKSFRPCKCGYQICVWCWHKIMEDSKRCPNCRRYYDNENLDFTPPDPEQIQTEKKKKVKKRKPFSRKQLANVRVIQRNLVYVVGLSLDIAPDDNSLLQWLKRPDNFGQYGKIMKVVINKNNLHQSAQSDQPTGITTASAYITYAKREDAYRAIQAVDDTWLDGKQLRASFGTTKYCAYFLRGIPCTNPECMYLHDYGSEEDTFNKEDIVLRNGLPVPLHTTKPFFEENDPRPVKKHVWNFRNSNVPQIDAFEQAYEEEVGEEEQEEEEQFPQVNNVLPSPSVKKDGSILPATAQWASQQESNLHSQQQSSTAANQKKKQKKQQKKLQKRGVADQVPQTFEPSHSRSQSAEATNAMVRTTKETIRTTQIYNEPLGTEIKQRLKGSPPLVPIAAQTINNNNEMLGMSKLGTNDAIQEKRQHSAADINEDLSSLDFSDSSFLLNSLDYEEDEHPVIPKQRIQNDINSVPLAAPSTLEPDDIAKGIIEDIVPSASSSLSWNPTALEVPELNSLVDLNISNETAFTNPQGNAFQHQFGLPSANTWQQAHQPMGNPFQYSFLGQPGMQQNLFQPNSFSYPVSADDHSGDIGDAWSNLGSAQQQSRKTSRFQFAQHNNNSSNTTNSKPIDSNMNSGSNTNNSWFEAMTTTTTTTTKSNFGGYPQMFNPFPSNPVQQPQQKTGWEAPSAYGTTSSYSSNDLQQTFRALLPNVNINFSYAQQERANSNNGAMNGNMTANKGAPQGFEQRISPNNMWGNANTNGSGSFPMVNNSININFYNINQQHQQQHKLQQQQHKQW